MTRLIASVVNRLLEPAGLQVRRLREPLYLRDFDIQTVLDIGANTGQFARRIRSHLPAAIIHSFEPLPAAYRQLQKVSQGDGRLYAHPIALGDADGDAQLIESTFTPSSSLLTMTENHTRAFPFATTAGTVRVPLARLDTWAAKHRLQGPLLIKLDVQGYEDRVLRGGARTVAEVQVLIVETSFTELYRDQMLFDGIHAFLTNLGFRCAGFLDLFQDPRSGATLQADAVFLRRGSNTPALS